MVETNSVFLLRSGFSARKVGGKVFVLATDGAMHILENESAVTLWEFIESAPARRFRPGDLAAALESTFNVDARTARSDSDLFIRKLQALGLVSEEIQSS